MTGPLATVIIPTFNRPQYLAVAIESALAQTLRDFELVVADDASTADVAGVVDRFHDKRIVFIRRSVNAGMATNIWAALSGARGRYVATLHDDDAWEPQFLEVTAHALETHADVSVAFTDHWIMNGSGEVDLAATEMNTRMFRRSALTPGVHFPSAHLVVEWNAIPVAMASLFRKSAIPWGEKPDEIGTFYDRWLGYLATRQSAVYYDPRRLTRYRVHSASETSTLKTTPVQRLRNARQGEALWRRILEDAHGARVHDYVRQRHRRSIWRAALMLAAHGEREQAHQLLEASGSDMGAAEHAVLRCAIALPDTAVSGAMDMAEKLRHLW